MSIKTRSKFYYGIEVNETNLAIDLEDGFGVVQITLNTGGYTLTEIANHLQVRLLELGNQDYTVTVDRENRFLTISAPSVFSVLFSSGPNSGQNAASLLGFSSADLTGQSSYTSSIGVGKVYLPQFFLLDYVPTKINNEANLATLNQTPNGLVETVRFGDLKKMRCNIRYITDGIECSGGAIEKNESGLDDALDFMSFLTKKINVEFMEDRNDSNTFETLKLDSTPQSQEGTAFELNEELPSLPDFYQTGRLVFRRIVL